ncbi:MAG: DNA polymerase III subunit alpha, partial [Endomicrobiales bacterium]
TVIDDAVKMVHKTNPGFNLETVSLSDEPTFKLLHNARALGVFQFESKGMRDLLRKLIPTTLEDIIALNALYRPGPIGAGMIDEFIARKHGKTKVKYDHQVLEPILKDTYGVILYQEQVMRIATDMAGFTAGQADGLRKAMGKKIPEEIEKQRGNFVAGADKKGIEKKLAEKVFDQIVHFGGYGFNKSHAAAYGMVSYRTAFLKANYPQQYMTALLNSEIGHSAVVKEDEESKIVGYIHDAENMGIAILPPDIQTSFERFAMEGTAIRFGLVAIKNVGTGAAESIVNARTLNGPFKSWEDFIGRIDAKATNRKVLESLIKAGACDTFGKPYTTIRAELTSQIDSSIGRASAQQRDTAIGQGLLFDEAAIVTSAQSTSPAVQAWTEHDALAQEKEVLGFYLSGHPLSQHQHDLLAYSQYRLDKLPPGSADPRSAPLVRLAGMIASAKKLVTKEKKEPYARFKLEDLHGQVEVVVFPKSYASGLARYIVPNTIVVVKGKLSGRDGGTEMLAEEIMSLDEAKQRLTPHIGTIRLKISTPGLEDEMLEKIKTIMESHPGKSPVIIDVTVPGSGEYIIETEMTVKFTPQFTGDIEKLIGEESWDLVPQG